MKKSDKAKEYFEEGYNCAQAVLCANCEQWKKLGLSKDAALKMTTGMGSGVRRGEICGAVTGGIMAIGLMHGFGEDKNLDERKITNDLTEEFQKRFEDLNGSTICRGLLKYDLSKEEDLKVIQEKKLFNTICPHLVESAVEILDEIL